MHGQSAGLGKTVYSTQGTVSIYIYIPYFFVTYIIIICTVEYIKNMLMKMCLESNNKFFLVSEMNYQINYIINIPVLEINNASQL